LAAARTAAAVGSTTAAETAEPTKATEPTTTATTGPELRVKFKRGARKQHKDGAEIFWETIRFHTLHFDQVILIS
jgi:hypothetical protein